MTEQISYLSQIQAGREGFVYLIHAEGTSRYKIGRSVNPISRMSDIQKQAPYPLKIVKSFWTLDAIADEAYLHKCYAEYRVFGEWFELGGLASGSAGDLSCSRLWQVKEAFYRGSLTMWKVAEDAITHLCEQLGIQEEYFQESTSFHDVYGSLNSRESVILTENFVRSTLHDLILGSNFCLGHDESVVDRKPSDKLQGFLLGCLISFVTLSLGRGRVQS